MKAAFGIVMKWTRLASYVKPWEQQKMVSGYLASFRQAIHKRGSIFQAPSTSFTKSLRPLTVVIGKRSCAKATQYNTPFGCNRICCTKVRSISNLLQRRGSTHTCARWTIIANFGVAFREPQHNNNSFGLVYLVAFRNTLYSSASCHSHRQFMGIFTCNIQSL